MTLIEGIGDEVTHFFIFLIFVLIATIAWWTTNISESGGSFRTVLLLERRVRVPRLTNHTESADIVEGDSNTHLQGNGSVLNFLHIYNVTNSDETATATATVQAMPTENKPPEVIAGSSSGDAEPASAIDEQSRIVECMDGDNSNSIIRRRRLEFYTKSTDGTPIEVSETEETTCSTSSTVTNLQESTEDSSETNYTTMEHNYADRVESSASNEVHQESQEVENLSPENKDSIKIKLKYLNDQLKVVDGNLQELLGDFKKRHFQLELSSNQLVRLIFNGHVLLQDNQSLKSCGLFDNCVVHCLIHQRRAQPAEENAQGPYATFRQTHNFNNNNQGREWHLENYLFASLCIFLSLAWYCRYVYSHLYTITATLGLVVLTGICTIVVIGMQFPDNETNQRQQRPNIEIIQEAQ